MWIEFEAIPNTDPDTLRVELFTLADQINHQSYIIPGLTAEAVIADLPVERPEDSSRLRVPMAAPKPEDLRTRLASNPATPNNPKPVPWVFSDPVSLLVYQDQNKNQKRDAGETIVATSDRMIRYIDNIAQQQQSQPWQSILVNSANIVGLHPVPKPFPLHHLQSSTGHSLRGTFGDIDQDISFIAFASDEESRDLKTNFKSAARALDVYIRDAASPRWELKPKAFAPAAAQRSPITLQIPGINTQNFWLQRIVGYRCPLGWNAPEGGFLSAECEIKALACQSGAYNVSMAALWIEGDTWISERIGAFYAARLRLRAGWNFIPLSLDRDPLFSASVSGAAPMRIAATSFTVEAPTIFQSSSKCQPVARTADDSSTSSSDTSGQSSGTSTSSGTTN